MSLRQLLFLVPAVHLRPLPATPRAAVARSGCARASEAGDVDTLGLAALPTPTLSTAKASTALFADVPADATPAVLRKRFHTLAQQLHPDSSEADEETFQALVAQYEERLRKCKSGEARGEALQEALSELAQVATQVAQARVAEAGESVVIGMRGILRSLAEAAAAESPRAGGGGGGGGGAAEVAEAAEAWARYSAAMEERRLAEEALLARELAKADELRERTRAVLAELDEMGL